MEDNGGGRKFRISPAVIFLLLILLYFVILIRADWSVFSELSEKKSALTRDIAGALAQRDKLKKEISQLDDPRYIELVARQKLGLIKQSETAYKVVK